MSTIDPDTVPGDYTGATPEIYAAQGAPDPLIGEPAPPDLEQRLTAQEVNTGALQDRVSALETSE